MSAGDASPAHQHQESSVEQSSLDGVGADLTTASPADLLSAGVGSLIDLSQAFERGKIVVSKLAFEEQAALAAEKSSDDDLDPRVVITRAYADLMNHERQAREHKLEAQAFQLAKQRAESADEQLKRQRENDLEHEIKRHAFTMQVEKDKKLLEIECKSEEDAQTIRTEHLRGICDNKIKRQKNRMHLAWLGITLSLGGLGALYIVAITTFKSGDVPALAWATLGVGPGGVTAAGIFLARWSLVAPGDEHELHNPASGLVPATSADPTNPK